VWCNPPYNRVAEFMAKAADSAKRGALVVLLVPSRTDTVYWHDYVIGMKAEVIMLKGRLKFLRNGVVAGTAPFPSAVVIFRPPGRRR
jgi:hypothetical protein